MKKSNNTHENVVNLQMSAIDAADDLSSMWEDALSSVSAESSFKQQALIWGGRGKGGRGVSRRTIQPRDVILQDVNLEYVSDATSGSIGTKTLLQNAHLKLLSGKVYAICGRNGCGKSTLLRRMSQKKIAGFTSLHLKMMYIPQEVFEMNDETPIEVVMGYSRTNQIESNDAAEARIRGLEEEMEGLDLECEENGEANMKRMEEICDEISTVEENTGHLGENEGSIDSDVKFKVTKVLEYFGIKEDMQNTAMANLSGGQKKKVLLACSLCCDLDLLLLDEPTNFLDMQGIIKLRGLIKTMQDQKTTVVLVSHDVDLINSTATDIVHYANQNLTYYRGNYNDFLIAKNDNDLHMIRQQHTLEKHRDSMIKTIDKLKKKSTGTSQKGNKKISKAVSSRKKKLERHGIEKDEHGHRSTVQKAGTGIRAGSINNLDASTRKKQSYRELLKRNDINVAPVPDKAVQFIFGDTNCTWGEPLISALDIGHGFGITNKIGTSTASKEKGMLFDSIDLCVGEGSTICILGENSSGKTTLLKLLAKDKGMQPLEGEVHYAHNANVSYFDQHKADELIVDGIDKYGSCTSSVALLCQMFPKKNEQDIRSELNNFGLGSQQVSTHIQFLSGGERCRLCLAMMMLEEPHVLLLDEISNHLDPESVEALGYGLKKWNGTIVLVSHDVHLIRLLEGICYVLVGNEGKLRRLEGGIDSYLKIMATTTE